MMENIYAESDKEEVEMNEKVQLSVINSTNYTYSWEPKEGLSNPGISNPIATPIQTTKYYVTVTKGNCKQIDSVLVKVKQHKCEDKVFIPTAFTPNGDGNNDEIRIRSDYTSSIYLAVYNKWGEKVFETNDKNAGWDGIYKGKNAPAGVYDYYLKCICINAEEFVKKGNITLVR
jgi:gliding motility-associated-like protein